MRDYDNDGYGEQNPNGIYISGSDCNDTDPYTFNGSAEKEDEEACMTDADGDGYGSNSPSLGALAGSDCDDSLSSVYVGAAYQGIKPSVHKTKMAMDGESHFLHQLCCWK